MHILYLNMLCNISLSPIHTELMCGSKLAYNYFSRSERNAI